MKRIPAILLAGSVLSAALLAGPADLFGATHPFAFRTPQAMACRAEEPTPAELAKSGPSDWLQAWPEGGSTNPVQLGSRLVLQLARPADLQPLIAGADMVLSRTVTPNTFILQAPNAWTAAREAHRLAALPQVLSAYPVMRRAGGLHGAYAPLPSDTNFNIQWYLEDRNPNGSSAGPDLNVRAAWPWTLGQGVTVALADTGIEMTHQELSNNVLNALHYNFVLQNSNALPVARTAAAAHGTEVAGLVAAAIDNFRLTGVAPGAQLAGWVIFDSNILLAADEQLMDMYQYQSNAVSVQNHSWGVPDDQVALGGPTLLEQIGISNAIAFGRNGLGAVMVRSAGNGRLLGENTGDSAYASDPRVIAVAAMRFDGRVAGYSTPGASILVAAPSGDVANNFDGLFTTDLIGTDGVNIVQYEAPNQDLSDYVYGDLGFSGTSASAPLISGVAGLILAANPALSYRDVQQILIFSSRQFDFADPDLTTNGAGFVVSHNQGFGVPDAGVAVNLARHWINRPPLTNITVTSTNAAAIPPDGLRVLVSGDGVPAGLMSIHCLPDVGPHADTPTPALPLVNVGLAAGPISVSLTNKAALIERGASTFAQQITNAAHAGAAFAVVYNFPASAGGSGQAPGGDQLLVMGATDFVPIPAVFIGNTDGTNLANFIQTNPAALAQIHLSNTNYVFTVTNTLICEQVGLRVMANNQIRGNLRITLVSPMGTRSVLQRYNSDTNPGPADWTYYSTHHFYESSAGAWTAYFSDEGAGNTGVVEGASLALPGVPILDTDADGLDDNWEIARFGSLAQGPKDDPDHDGYSNMREQIMGTDPNVNNNIPIPLDLSPWEPGLGRLSWPSSAGFTFQIRAGTNAASLPVVATVPGGFPVTEWFTNTASPPWQFFQIEALPLSP
jgi:subtilisin family serine protease